MQNKVEGILRQINRDPKEDLHVLTFATHESSQENLSTLPIKYYLYQGQGVKIWENKYRQLPKNHILLDGSPNQIKPDIKLDCVLSQNKFAHWKISKQIAQQCNIPLINLEHCLPHPKANEKYLTMYKSMESDLDLFISHYSMKKWGYEENGKTKVINHGINTEVFKRNKSILKEGFALSVCNDLKNRQWACGYNEWQQLVSGFPNKILGSNPGLSEPAKSLDDLVENYNKAVCFVSSSLVSPIPTVVLEAMSCSLPIICLDNCCLPEIVQDGFNGFISNDIEYLRSKIKLLLESPKLAIELGENARKTIEDKFSLKNHLNQWMQIFKEIVQ